MQRYDLVAPNHKMNKRITISMPPELEAKLAAAKPKYQSLSGFYCELLDSGVTLGKPSRETAAEPEEGEVLPSKAVKQVNELVSSSSKKNTRARSPFSSKQLPDDCIPNDVIDCDQLLREWWSVKKGTRSENVFNRVCRKLAAMTPEDRRKALEAASNAGWADVYEPRPTPGQTHRPVGVVSTPPLSSAMQEWMKS